MKNFLLVLSREYRIRVRRPIFWVLTILVPILLIGLYALPYWILEKDAAQAHVAVVDDSGLFGGAFKTNNRVSYTEAATLDVAEQLLQAGKEVDAVLYIPKRETTIPSDAFLYYRGERPALDIESDVDHQVQSILRNRVLEDVHGISQDDYAYLSATRIRIHAQDVATGRDGFLKVKLILGIVLALLVVAAVALFGTQVMNSMGEEKSNRVAELLITSVKPFELMMGKIVGVALVGITQFVLWMLLIALGIGGVQSQHGTLYQQAMARQQLSAVATKGDAAVLQAQEFAQQGKEMDLLQGLAAIDWKVITGMALFYFVFGYLLYATLFAIVGAKKGPYSDSQQLSYPILLLLLIPLFLLPLYINAPSGDLAVWLSVIPFTSPVAMLFRIPFGVKLWQLGLSIALLLVSIPVGGWIAARTYKRSLEFRF